jgi:hypothetical protein
LGKSYGYEVAKAWLYLFKMNIQTIYASTHQNNSDEFWKKISYDWFLNIIMTVPCVWYELDKINYQK